MNIKETGCYFGNLADLNPALLDELAKLKLLCNPNNFNRLTHSYLKPVEKEATTWPSFEEANVQKQYHLDNNLDGTLWQTFFTFDVDNPNLRELRTQSIEIARPIFLEIFKFIYGEERFNEIEYIEGWNTNITFFNKDCFIGKHADGVSKRMICNILLYLSDDWTENCGGELVIEEKYTQQPKFGNFAVIDFEDINPVHTVSRITSDTFNRYTILTGILKK